MSGFQSTALESAKGVTTYTTDYKRFQVPQARHVLLFHDAFEHSSDELGYEGRGRVVARWPL